MVFFLYKMIKLFFIMRLWFYGSHFSNKTNRANEGIPFTIHCCLFHFFIIYIFGQKFEHLYIFLNNVSNLKGAITHIILLMET